MPSFCTNSFATQFMRNSEENVFKNLSTCIDRFLKTWKYSNIECNELCVIKVDISKSRYIDIVAI